MVELIENALNGDALAQFQLGTLFAEHDGGKNEAKLWLEKAAEQNLHQAQIALAKLIYDAQHQADAVRWLAAAAQSGLDDAWKELIRIAEEDISLPARFALGMLYLEANAGHTANMEQAGYWLSEAAMDGSKDALEKLFELSTRENSSLFLQCISQVLLESGTPLSNSQQDHARASLRLASIYRQNDDFDSARTWLQTAAREGNVEALLDLLELIASSNDPNNDLPQIEGQLCNWIGRFRQESGEIKQRCGKVLCDIADREAESARQAVSGVTGPVAEILQRLSNLGNFEAAQDWQRLQAEQNTAVKHADRAIDDAFEAEALGGVNGRPLAIIVGFADDATWPSVIAKKAHYFAGEILHKQVSAIPEADQNTQINLVQQARDHFNAAGDYKNAAERLRNMDEQLYALNHPPLPHNYNPTESND